MKPQINQHVKCVFRNGTVVEGIVESWDKEAILTSLDGANKLIIMRPDDDIMLIKLVLKSQKLSLSELEHQFEKTLAQPSDTPNRLETLAELRTQLAEAEKQVVAQKMKDHHIGTPRLTKYQSPYDLGAIKGGTIFQKMNKRSYRRNK